jgi:hypothetical protein
MYQWQLEHKCGTCMMALRHIIVELCEMFSATPIMTDGPTAWPPRLPDFNPLDFYMWEHLKTVVYAAFFHNEEVLHHRVLDTCQTILNYPGIFEWMRRSMTRHVEARIESHGGHFVYLL